PRALEAFALEGVLVHHALLERAVQGAERIEDVVPEILPALVDRLAETLGHDPQKVLRLLLVLPFLDLLAALVLVDRLQREVDVSLLLVDLQDLADDLLAFADVVPDVLDPAGGDLRDVDEALLALVLVQGHERAEILRPVPGPLMGLVPLAAAEPQMDPFRRFLAALRLRTREAAISGGHAPEPPLPRPELRPRTVLDPLHFELPVLVAERTITADTLRHLHGGRPGAVTEKNLE